MSFEDVDDDDDNDDGRTTDACLYYKLTYEPSAQVSLKMVRTNYIGTQYFNWTENFKFDKNKGFMKQFIELSELIY